MTVYLVGAGPGDPSLLTVRGAELIGRADVVVFDRLVDPRVLALALPTAKLVDVGKRVGDSTVEQHFINEQLVEFGRSYDCVVRLKGGDPYVFGRGGEEAQALEDARCPYEVISGVSSFVAAPAAAGVPLTMRGVSSSFIVVTGHDALSGDSSTDWEAVVRTKATVVILMGTASRAGIARRLMSAGLPGSTPAVIVEAATTSRQRSIRTRLDELDTHRVESPATIVIGDVAGLAFASYEDRPLSGWRVVVTQDVDQSNELRSLIELAGGEVINVPTIEIVTSSVSRAQIRAALANLSSFDWIVFASNNAVENVMGELLDARAFGGVRVGAIGSATAQVLAQHGILADYVPSKFVGEAFVAEFPAPEAGSNNRVLLPRAKDGRDVIETGLRGAGWEVETIDAYETVHSPVDATAVVAMHQADLVTFTSSSTVEGLMAGITRDQVPTLVACIGPITAKTAREHGLQVAIEADRHTVEGLASDIVAYARRHPRNPS